MKEINLSVNDRINVVLNIFRVGSNDRAVIMIVGFGKFIPFIWNTGIEDRLNAIVDQPLYMSVCQLSPDNTRIHSGWNQFPVRIPCGWIQEKGQPGIPVY